MQENNALKNDNEKEKWKRKRTQDSCWWQWNDYVLVWMIKLMFFHQKRKGNVRKGTERMVKNMSFCRSSVFLCWLNKEQKEKEKKGSDKFWRFLTSSNNFCQVLTNRKGKFCENFVSTCFTNCGERELGSILIWNSKERKGREHVFLNKIRWKRSWREETKFFVFLWEEKQRRKKVKDR